MFKQFGDVFCAMFSFLLTCKSWVCYHFHYLVRNDTYHRVHTRIIRTELGLYSAFLLNEGQESGCHHKLFISNMHGNRLAHSFMSQTHLYALITVANIGVLQFLVPLHKVIVEATERTAETVVAKS